MNPIQAHLALNHLPIAFALVGVPLLAYALWRKSSEMRGIALGLLLLAGVVAIPVSLSGEGARLTVSRGSEIAQALVKRHEESAELALILVQFIAGISFLILAYEHFKKPVNASLLKGLVIAGAFNLFLMFHAAHEGGQITHPEVRVMFSFSRS